MPKLWSSGLPVSTKVLHGTHILHARVLQVRYLTLAYDLHRPPGQQKPHHAPILIMHGLFGSKQNNRSISKAIARELQREIYAVDLRNHGDSAHDSVHDYKAMSVDVEEFMEQHDIQNPCLIGHSMGAKVAMTVALQSPKKVGSIISVDNAPADVVLKGGFARYTYAMRKIQEARVKNAKEADKILQEYEEALPIRQFLLTNLIRTPGSNTLQFRIPIQILSNSLGNMGDFPFNDPEEARYDGPTLFVRGTKSDYVPDEMLPLIGRFFPRFELRDIDSGHWVISERPEAFRKAVVEFLQEKA